MTTPFTHTHLVVSDFSRELTRGRILIDVRTSSEYAHGHIADARLFDVTDAHFLENIRSLDPKCSYALYCRSGGRSSVAAQHMRALGFVDVVDLEGGLLAWEAAGNTVCIDC
ncbi:MAG: rhodanese-like domain-containing protein [Candidatus Pacebacteria bacterium]|nr:rhodanese-like domain-containing protein [Candidatus Paceibacterota bacterium]